MLFKRCHNQMERPFERLDLPSRLIKRCHNCRLKWPPKLAKRSQPSLSGATAASDRNNWGKVNLRGKAEATFQVAPKKGRLENFKKLWTSVSQLLEQLGKIWDQFWNTHFRPPLFILHYSIRVSAYTSIHLYEYPPHPIGKYAAGFVRNNSCTNITQSLLNSL
jgi:hypothetical protein